MSSYNYPTPPDGGSRARPLDWGEERRLPPRRRRVRPTGVTVLAALNFVGVGFSMLLLLYVTLSPPITPELPAAEQTALGDQSSPLDFSGLARGIQVRQEQDVRNLLACLAVIEIPFGIVVGVGLWQLRAWGRKLALWLYGGGAILSLLVNYTRPLTGATLISILIGAAVFVYLLQPDVRRAFSQTPA